MAKSGKPKVGRPSAFDPDIAAEILDGLCDGLSLRVVCLRDTMPSARSVHRWLSDGEGKEFDLFRQQYARAREIQASTLFDGIIEAVGLVQSGRLDSKAGRTIIYGLEIVASRLHPKKFGRKLDVSADVNANVGLLAIPVAPGSLEAWRELDEPMELPEGQPEIVAEQAPQREVRVGGAGVVRV